MTRRRSYPRKHRQFLDSIRIHYDVLLNYQQGKCAICGRLPSEKRKFDIDHNHRDMFVRGLLCVRCNRALADWMDTEWLRSAANYVEERGSLWFTLLTTPKE